MVLEGALLGVGDQALLQKVSTSLGLNEFWFLVLDQADARDRLFRLTCSFDPDRPARIADEHAPGGILELRSHEELGSYVYAHPHRVGEREARRELCGRLISLLDKWAADEPGRAALRGQIEKAATALDLLRLLWAQGVREILIGERRIREPRALLDLDPEALKRLLTNGILVAWIAEAAAPPNAALAQRVEACRRDPEAIQGQTVRWVLGDSSLTLEAPPAAGAKVGASVRVKTIEELRACADKNRDAIEAALMSDLLPLWIERADAMAREPKGRGSSKTAWDIRQCRVKGSDEEGLAGSFGVESAQQNEANRRRRIAELTLLGLDPEQCKSCMPEPDRALRSPRVATELALRALGLAAPVVKVEVETIRDVIPLGANRLKVGRVRVGTKGDRAGALVLTCLEFEGSATFDPPAVSVESPKGRKSALHATFSSEDETLENRKDAFSGSMGLPWDQPQRLRCCSLLPVGRTGLGAA